MNRLLLYFGVISSAALCGCKTDAKGPDCGAGYYVDGATCVDVDECAIGTAGCSANADCANTPGSFTCTCKAGFSGDGITCTDVDECAAGTAGCSPNATCANTVGSFTCTCNEGFDGNGVTCTDVDECAALLDDCSINANCTNTVGGFTCACKSGFTGDGITCSDIDECAAPTSPCHGTSTCQNNPGSYECTCPTGYHYDGSDCVDTDECAAYAPVTFTRAASTPSQVDKITDGVWIARGNSGPLFNAAVETAAAPGGCDTTSPAGTEWARGSCIGNRGEFTSFPKMAGCSPQSVVGHTVCLHLVAEDQYYDVDFSSYAGGGSGGGFSYTRTLVIGGACGGVLSCTNTVGSFTCDSCLTGFQLSAEANPTCVDIDECTDPASCGTGSTCTNRPGTFRCACDTGYAGYPYGSCYNVDECSEGIADCDVVNGTCTDTSPGFTCGCVAPAELQLDGTTCLATCTPACGANEVCLADGSNTYCVCGSGFVPDTVNGGCKLPDRCADAATVYFRKPGFASGYADCVVPDVCITRGLTSGLFNAAFEVGTFDGAESPVGTLWFASTCADAVANSSVFARFQTLGHPVGTSLCMYLPEHGLMYDLTLTEWGSFSGGAFAYIRTPYQPDGCGLSLDSSLATYATCSAGSCGCPTGWTIDGTSGKCRMPDPCATDACDASATCDRTGFTTYRCECGGVDFVKESYSNDQDCIRPDICITRGDYDSLFNAAQEDGPSYSISPAGTLWAMQPCATALDTDFGNFIGPSFANGQPPRYLGGRHGCLKLLEVPGTYAEQKWDIEFSSWSSGGTGGGFAYHRWHDVADAVACQ